jgi:hypothetical protein
MIYASIFLFMALLAIPLIGHFKWGWRKRWVVIANLAVVFLSPIGVSILALITVSGPVTSTNLSGWLIDLAAGWLWGCSLYLFFVIFGLPTRRYWKGLGSLFFQLGSAFDPRLGPNKYSTKVGENKYLSGTKKTTGSKKLAESNLPKPSELTLSGLWDKYFKKK